MSREIPFFNYQAMVGPKPDEMMQVVEGVIRKGAFIMQSELEEFERNAADFLGIKHVIGVADGTNAIVLSLYAAGIGPGDEVILPSHTYVATANAVKMVGATSVLVECGPDHMIDPQAVSAAITPKTKAIMPVQLNGRIADMDKLCSIAESNNLLIIEDAAQAFGAKYKGSPAGSFGFAATISYYPAKVLGCFGDGGAVLTKHDEVAERIKLLRDHGRSDSGEVVTWGTNSRLDNLQAAVLDFKLKTFSDEIKRRREIAAMYNEALSKIDDLTLPPGPDDDPDHFDIYQNYEIESGRRDELRSHLQDKGVRTIIQWGGKAVHQIEGLGFKVSLPFTEKFFERCFLLPMNTSLSNEDVDYIIDCISEFYGEK